MDRPRHSASGQDLFLESLEPRQFFSTSVNQIIAPSLVFNAAANSSASVSGYTPAEIKAAYGISSISLNGVTGNGAGQAIAIVDAFSDPNIASDLSVFDKQFGLATANFTQVSATGSKTKLPTSDAGWDGEISLDVEWAHAIAPKANIILVDASSDTLSSLMSAVEYARTISSVSVISMSWGSSEFSGQTGYDKYFTTPSGHIGITFVAASGDDGAAGGAEWPASSPNVLAVGGTTLSLTSAGTVAGETAWSGSSGGVSAFESTPSYQSTLSNSGRSTPDVSFNADPNTGFAVYDSVNDQGYVGWQVVGGTSAGAPAWSALISIADQGRLANGLGTLDGATGTLPAIYNIYSNPTTYAADFTDITSGSSSLSQGGFGGPFGGWRRGHTVEVSASVGYDTLTGIGTPKAAALLATLSTVGVSKSAVVKTAMASAAKVVKTKAAVAIEFNRVAAVLGIANAGAPMAMPIQRAESDIEIETTATTTAAATIAKTNSGVVDAVDLSNGSFPPFGAQPNAGDPDAATIRRLVADTSASANAPVASTTDNAKQSDAKISSQAATASAVPGLLSETVVPRDFLEMLKEFAPATAAGPAARPRPQSPPSTWLVAGAAAVADAVLLGYFYAREKKNMDSENVFSDESVN